MVSGSIWARAAASFHLHFLSTPVLGWLFLQKNSQTPLENQQPVICPEESSGGTFLWFSLCSFLSICEDLLVNYCTTSIHKTLFFKCNISPAPSFLFHCTQVGYLAHCKWMHKWHEAAWPSRSLSRWLPPAGDASSCRLIFSDTYLFSFPPGTTLRAVSRDSF